MRPIAGAGFEPTTFGLWARRATRLLHPAIILCLVSLPKENVGFEPTRRFLDLTVFKTVPFSQTWVILQNKKLLKFHQQMDLVGLEPTTGRL